MKRLFLSAVFVASVSFMSAQETTKDQMPAKKEWKQRAKEMQQKRWDNMKKELGLTAEQETQIKAMNRKNMEDMKANQLARRKELKERRQAWMKKNDDQMKSILTSDQYTKWQEMKQKKSKMRKDKAAKWNKRAKMSSANK